MCLVVLVTPDGALGDVHIHESTNRSQVPTRAMLHHKTSVGRKTRVDPQDVDDVSMPYSVPIVYHLAEYLLRRLTSFTQ